MSDIKTGGPAFPQDQRDKDGSGVMYFGMTLRDYFAIHASPEDIAPFIRKVPMQVAETAPNTNYTRLITREVVTPTSVARYAFADAMLKAREA